MIDSDKSIKANIVEQHTVVITTTTGGTTNPAPGTYTPDSGSQITISAIPKNNYRFTGWSGDLTGTVNPITIDVNSEMSITANFIRQYTLTMSAGNNGTTDPGPGSHIYDSGTEVTLTALPDTHYDFLNWSGDLSSSTNPTSIIMDSDKSVVASFQKKIYAPSNFTGQKELSRTLFRAEYINVLSWQANSNNSNIIKYWLFLVEGGSQTLVIELDSNTFEYWHMGVEEDKSYTYALVAMNNEGREGNSATTIVN